MENATMKPKVTVIRDLNVIDPNAILHVLEEGEVGVALEWMVQDPLTGRVQEHVIKKSESFVRGFMDVLFTMMGFKNKTIIWSGMQDTSGVYRAICSAYNNFQANGGIADVSNGIAIGTGAVAPTVSDYALGNQIWHATMNYGAMAFGAPASDATTSQFTLTRNFANVSGGAVTVNEIGLFVNGYMSSVLYRIMTIRDVIGGGIAVPNGQTLTINYRPQVVI